MFTRTLLDLVISHHNSVLLIIMVYFTSTKCIDLAIKRLRFDNPTDGIVVVNFLLDARYP